MSSAQHADTLDLDTILAALRQGDPLPASDAQRLASFLEYAIAARAARVANARASAQKNRQRVRDGVRLAIGCLPPLARDLGTQHLTTQTLNWIAKAGPEAYGLRSMPDRGVVCDEVQAMERERIEKQIAKTQRFLLEANRSDETLEASNHPQRNP